MVTEEAVLASIRDVVDPELGVNVVELGLIRGIEIGDRGIRVRMALTAPGCPFAGYIVDRVRERVTGIAEGLPVEVQVVDEVWTPGWA